MGDLERLKAHRAKDMSNTSYKAQIPDLQWGPMGCFCALGTLDFQLNPTKIMPNPPGPWSKPQSCETTAQALFSSS